MRAMATHEPAARSRVPFLCGLLALAVYIPTMGFGFVWDDTQLIGRPGWLESFTFADVLSSNAWNTVGGDDHYRPFMFLTYRLDVALWGLDPAGYHLSSALIHAIVVYLVGSLLLRFRYGSRAAMWGTLLFLIHPVHVESTAWVAGRADVLSAVFMLIVVNLLLRSRSSGGDILAALGFLAALLTKEVSVILVPALLALSLAPRSAGDGDDITPRPETGRVLRCLVPVVLVYFALRIGLAGTTRSYPFAAPRSLVEWLLVLVTDVKLVGRYLTILILGANHGPIPYDEGQPHDVTDLTSLAASLGAALDLEACLALVALLAPIPFLYRTARRHPGVWFATALGFPAIALSMNLTTAGALFPFSDRFLFLATLLPAVLGAIAIDTADRAGGTRPALVRSVLSALVVLWAYQLVVRLPRYHDLGSFCEEAVRLNPGSPLARDGLAVIRAQQRRQDEAAGHAEIALALRPTAARLQAAILMQLARHDLARALELARHHPRWPRPPRSAALLAQAALRLDRLPEADDLANEATLATPAPPEAWIALGLVRARQGRTGDARQAYRQAIDLAPGEAIGYHNLGLLEIRAGNHAAVGSLVEEAVRAGVPRESLAALSDAATPPPLPAPPAPPSGSPRGAGP